MNQRTSRVVVAALVALLVATAGCSAFSGGAQTDLRLVNNDDAAHDVTVELVEDGEVVYAAETTVDSETNAELDSFAGTGEYDVVVQVDGERSTFTHTFSESEDTLTIGIQNDGSVVLG